MCGSTIPAKLEKAAKRFKLTEREQLTIYLLASGKKQEAVASEMGITRRGVQFHVSKIFRKIGAGNSVEALAKLVFL